MSRFRPSWLMTGTYALVAAAAFCQSRSARGELFAYEGFDYSAVDLHEQGGGFGWSGPWARIQNGLEAEAIFNVSQDGVSLDSPAYPVDAAGGRLEIGGPGGGGGNNTRVVRTLTNAFSLAEDGVLYASLLLQKNAAYDGIAAANNLEFDLLSGTANPVRFGSTSTNQWFVNEAAQAFGSVAQGEAYFLVLRVEAFAQTNDVRSVMIFDSAQTVPAAEPTTWDFSNDFSSDAVIDGVRLWVGRQASGQIDEIRIGTTWASVTVDEVVFPEPTLPGDFNDDGHVDAADLSIWKNHFGAISGGTTAMGDANGDGAVDGTDFLVWQRHVTASGTIAAVPEPTASLLAVVAMAALWKQRRSR